MELKEIEQIKSQLNDKGIANDSVLAISIEKVIESKQKQIEELKQQLEQREEELLLDLLEWLSDSNEHNIRKSELSEILEDYLDYKQIKQ